MKLKKLFALVLVLVLALILVACGDNGKEEEQKADPLVPTAISLKVRTAKVQINNTIKLTYTITPATAQDNEVKITLSNDLATYAKEGNKYINLTAGAEAGNIKVTVETTNGFKASKTIKIQVEEVQSYPDLSGYTIKIAQAESALGEYDVKLTKETEAKYGYYSSADKEYKVQAWDEMEENYNCNFAVVAYPSDAPWGPARWSYILTQAQNESPEYDFYVTPNSEIPSYVAGNAVVDVTDWYAAYGQNCMSEMAVTANSYKGRLYGFFVSDESIKIVLGVNLNLLAQIQKIDPTIKEPATLYLEGNWDFDDFEAYAKQVQTALDTMSTEEEKYYALSGYGVYYWQCMVNASGVKILDPTQMQVNLTGETETLAAQTLRDIYAAGCTDPAFQVDEGVVSWNSGRALFNVGSFWFVNHQDRWPKNLWGEDNTKYGYVPFPCKPGLEVDGTYVGITSDACFCMAASREWAYAGFGEDCTAENIFRAYIDYYVTAKKYYTTNESYDKVGDARAFASERFSSEDSVKAYLQVTLGKDNGDGTYSGGLEEYGFFDPYVSSNPVVGSYGATGTLAGDINAYIKGGEAQWVDAVGTYYETIKKALVDAYG